MVQLQCDATCWGRLLPDEFLEMTIGKLSYEFRRSLVNNDDPTLPDIGNGAASRCWRGHGFSKPDALKPSRNAEPRCVIIEVA
jgi:hypothetical protein